MPSCKVTGYYVCIILTQDTSARVCLRAARAGPAGVAPCRGRGPFDPQSVRECPRVRRVYRTRALPYCRSIGPASTQLDRGRGPSDRLPRRVHPVVCRVCHDEGHDGRCNGRHAPSTRPKLPSCPDTPSGHRFEPGPNPRISVSRRAQMLPCCLWSSYSLQGAWSRFADRTDARRSHSGRRDGRPHVKRALCSQFGALVHHNDAAWRAQRRPLHDGGSRALRPRFTTAPGESACAMPRRQPQASALPESPIRSGQAHD